MRNTLCLLMVLLTSQLAFSQQNSTAYLHISTTDQQTGALNSSNLRGVELSEFDVPTYLSQHSDTEVKIFGRDNDNQDLISYEFDSKKIEGDIDCPNYCEKIIRLEQVPYMGVAISGMDDFSGVRIESILDETSAEDSELQEGDVITSIEALEVTNPCQLKMAVGDQPADEWVNVSYIRDGNSKQTMVKMGYRIRKHITWVKCCDIIENEPLETFAGNYLQLEVYPNPTAGVTQYDLQTASFEQADVQLLDLNGKVIIHKQVVPIDGQWNDFLDLGNLSGGVYILNVTQAKETISKRIIVQTK